MAVILEENRLKRNIVKRLYSEEGLTQKQIGEKFGLSANRIGDFMRKEGIPRRRRFTPVALRYSEEEKRLLALALDLEGSISMRPNKPSATSQGRGGISAVVQVANTNREILDYIHKIARVGKVNFRKSKTKKHKDMWDWQIHRVPLIRAFLEQIKPYLIIKKEQAELAIRFCASRMSMKGWNPPYTSQQLELVDKLHILNLTGKVR